MWVLLVGLAAGATYPYPAANSQASSVFAISTANRSNAELLCIDTLAGNLARDTPQLYRVATASWTTDTDSSAKWLRDLQATRGLHVDTSLLDASLQDILTHFKQSISSVLRSGGADASTAAAITLAAAGERLIVADDDATAAAAAAAGVGAGQDVRGKTVSDVLSGDVVGNLSTRVIVFQDQSKIQFLGDYAVFARAPFLQYNSDANAQKQLLSRSTDIGVCLGWGPENEYVSTCNQHGKYVHASDYNINLAMLSNAPARGSKARTLHANHTQTGVAAGVHTVTFVMTDGDNIQWTLGPWATQDTWFGADRGKVPMGWTFCSAVAQLAPSASEVVRGMLTPQDELVAGPSGVGYAYPTQWPEQELPDFAALTADSMTKMGMRVLNVLGQNDKAPNLDQLSTFASSSQVDGIIYYGFGEGYDSQHGQLWWAAGKPVVTGRYSLWNNGTFGTMLGVDALIKALARQPKTPENAAGYSVIPVHAWSHSYADVVKVAQGLQALGGIDIVTPSELIARVKANIKPVLV